MFSKNIKKFYFSGTKVRIELKKADSKFMLMKDSTDTEKYKFVITECTIYVPVAQLSLPVFNQLSSLLTENSVSIHYRKTEIREVSLPKDKIEYFSDNLFSDDIPCRVVVCFIQSDRKQGNYLNPYDFRRYWVVPKTATTNTESNLRRDRMLEEKIESIQKTLDLILQGQTTSKGGPRKSSDASLLNRLRETFSATDRSGSDVLIQHIGVVYKYLAFDILVKCCP